MYKGYCEKCGVKISVEDAVWGKSMVWVVCPSCSETVVLFFVGVEECGAPVGNSPPSSEQIGGDHYKNMAIQPIDFIHKNNIPFIEGSVIKYVCRHRNKNGRQDIEKAIHFLQMLIEKDYAE